MLFCFHRKFFKSANFEGWLRCRQQEIRQKLELLHLEALGKAVSISHVLGVTPYPAQHHASVIILYWWLSLFFWSPLVVNFYCSSFSIQDVCRWIKDKQEVEIVDLFLQIKEKLVCLIHPGIVPSCALPFLSVLHFFVGKLWSQWTKPRHVPIQVKATEQYFHLILFIILYNVVPPFD